MKIKLTLNLPAFCIFISAVAMLTSCSVSNQLSSKSPHYHLNLVKANNHNSNVIRAVNEGIESDITPLSHHSAMVSTGSDKKINELNSALKMDMKLLTKDVKKSSPVIYKQIRTINLNNIFKKSTKNNTPISAYNKLSVDNNNSMGGGHGYFGLFLLFMLLALLFWILSIGTGIFGLLGLISTIAAVIFFILWIVSLA